MSRKETFHKQFQTKWVLDNVIGTFFFRMNEYMKQSSCILYAVIGLGLTIILGIFFGMRIQEGMAVSDSDIPKGDENMYILKSEIVPPVCPKCPDVELCPKCGGKPCTPCPPCGRCPEPAFECKKVPNYSSTNQDYLPRPLLNSFAQF
jgi:hypothetical protein